ncbi:lytic transglycosylase domain-containing protein [Ramlibacter ginsenosidimutans]|uniref:Lytic transglycosylase domain-containing protein n=1 Tax=Ramlibacter ginsenosidimutans TaxID=502333 RepID=A0A934TP75_9BURK|nr:lytic transglycosylase domain-containing protein [Ramlibacter ginsenosidimutans]MBK6004854.1 lytic transglycosylase domain-containing protein [Ramlibacter ginsenosidimutans]
MKLRTILASLVIVLAGCVQAQPRDDVILDMQRAFAAGNRARLTQLLPLAQGHVLEPWAAYWELRARLDTAGPSEIQQFLARYAGTYQEDRLRNDWLQLLGERRDWDTFAQEYPKFRMKDDREVRCYALLVQAQRDASTIPAVSEDVRRNWLAQREADDGCTLAAATLLDKPGSHVTSSDAWRKVRQAVETGRVRAATAALQMVKPDALPLLAELNAHPTKFLTSKVFAASRMRREVVGLALIKLATTDVENAANQLESKWGPQIHPEERDWVWGVIGRQAAYRMLPAADGYFSKVQHDRYLSDELLGWKVRAALRAPGGPDWRNVQEAIGAMSEDAKADPAWTYWRARALLAASKPSEAQRGEAERLLDSIASPRGFYEQLALEELGRPITVPPKPAPLTDDEKKAARQEPGLTRALYAISIGLRPEGTREWNYTTNLHRSGGYTDRELLAAAQYACEREVWDRCINTSERTRTEFDFEQRFPMPFRDAVVQRAKEIDLDPAYVYGLIRQESRFVTEARSGVGAHGLMQVMPATARWTARKLGLSGFTVDQLGEKDTNIAIGTGYLKLVLDDFGGSMPMAAAAYNAGPSRSRAWRNGPVLEGAAWAETVPFQETRDYVKKVLANTTLYAAMLTGQPQSLKARLGMIGPRDVTLPTPNIDLP